MGAMRRALALLLMTAGCPKPGQTPGEAPPPTAPATEASGGEATPPDDESELQWHKLTAAGAEIEYATVGTPREGGPVVLALPPGPQTKEMVTAGLERWADAMAADGFFAISPVSPAGTFFKESAGVLPGFIDAAAQAHGFAGDGLLLFGMSNGGLSAFTHAIAQPHRFRALVTIPGRPVDDDLGKLGALAGIPVTMIVGANDDAFWVSGAEQAKAAIEAAGGTVTLELLDETGHAAHLDIDWPTLRQHFGA